MVNIRVHNQEWTILDMEDIKNLPDDILNLKMNDPAGLSVRDVFTRSSENGKPRYFTLAHGRKAGTLVHFELTAQSEKTRKFELQRDLQLCGMIDAKPLNFKPKVVDLDF